MVIADKVTYEKPNMSITGATLLSFEEAKKLPYYLRKYAGRWWWLRSPGYTQNTATFVDCDDFSVNYSDLFVNYVNICVRPALQIKNIEYSNLQIGDHFTFGGKVFEVVSDNLAFCTSDIGCYAFRNSWMANDANDYEKSDVKKFVDNWFTTAICLDNEHV